MIKFSGNNEGKRLIGFGLSRANIERLVAGKAILVDLSEMGAGIDGKVFIFYGESETEMEAMLRPMIGPDTKLMIDPKLKL